MIHSEALAANHLELSMSEVLSLRVKVVNSIKTCPLQSRMFWQLCNELGSEYSNLLLRIKVRRLSRGKVIERLFELREKVLLFLQAHNTDLALLDSDQICLETLAHLSDIFYLRKGLNLSFQRRNKVISIIQKLLHSQRNSQFRKTELMTMY